MDQDRRPIMAILCLLDEGLSLLDNPRSIRIASTLRDDDLTAFKVDEDQDIQVDYTPSCDRSFRKEVAGAQCLGMGFQVISPGSLASSGTRLDILLFASFETS